MLCHKAFLAVGIGKRRRCANPDYETKFKDICVIRNEELRVIRSGEEDCPATEKPPLVEPKRWIE
jgi:hypothetical protein